MKISSTTESYALSTFIYLLVLVVVFSSCKKDKDCDNCNNQSPISNAGTDHEIQYPVDTVLLNGSSSSDPDGSIVRYEWRKISGPLNYSITKKDSAITSVKYLLAGVYYFELSVQDNGGLFSRDTVVITVKPLGAIQYTPNANAGPDDTLFLPESSVIVNGNKSVDANQNIASYQWSWISGPSIYTLQNSNSVSTSINNLVHGIYHFELKVTDSGGLFSRDTMRVLVFPASCLLPRPVINAQLIQIGTLSTTKSHLSVGHAGNKIVFTGGIENSESVSSVDIYDVSTQSWSTAQLSIPRYDITVASLGSKIFFAGGYHFNDFIQEVSKRIDIYDATTNSWSIDSLSVGRMYMAAATLGNNVFFAGGLNALISPAVYNTVDILNLSNNSWSQASLSKARLNISAIPIGNKIYFAGGELEPYTSTSRIDIYDQSTSSWTTSELVKEKSGMAAIANGGKIYCAGGNNFQPASLTTRDVEIIDVNNGFTSISCLTHPVDWSYVSQGAIQKNDKLVFLNGNSSYPNQFDIYSISDNSWSTGILPFSITNGVVISVNNVIYVAGGYVNGVLSNKVYRLEF